MVNSLCIDINTVTQLSSSTAITVSRTVVPNVTDSYILNTSANITSNITVNSEFKIINTFNINHVFTYLKDIRLTI